MSINKAVVAAALGLSMLVPVITQAAGLTTEQANAIVVLLQSFNADAKTVEHVQMILTNQNSGGMHSDHMMGSSTWSGASTTPWGTPPGQMGKMACIALTRDLKVGSQGDDVRKLQDLLHDDDSAGFTASSTGFFGPMTAKAMARFQMHNGIASTTTGIVGRLTRGFFERACGKGVGNEHGGMMGSTTHQ